MLSFHASSGSPSTLRLHPRLVHALGLAAYDEAAVLRRGTATAAASLLVVPDASVGPHDVVGPAWLSSVGTGGAVRPGDRVTVLSTRSQLRGPPARSPLVLPECRRVVLALEPTRVGFARGSTAASLPCGCGLSDDTARRVGRRLRGRTAVTRGVFGVEVGGTLLVCRIVECVVTAFVEGSGATGGGGDFSMGRIVKTTMFEAAAPAAAAPAIPPTVAAAFGPLPMDGEVSSNLFPPSLHPTQARTLFDAVACALDAAASSDAMHQAASVSGSVSSFTTIPRRAQRAEHRGKGGGVWCAVWGGRLISMPRVQRRPFDLYSLLSKKPPPCSPRSKPLHSFVGLRSPHSLALRVIVRTATRRASAAAHQRAWSARSRRRRNPRARCRRCG